jgi:hypothetical protein
MKKTKIYFWIITGLFSAFMIFSSIPDIMMSADAIKFMSHLGYPNYIIPFLGVLKLLGIIAILIPGFPRIKEWAYAGLFFELTGATYSVMANDGFHPEMSVMFVIILFVLLSYILYHKIQAAK